MKKRVILSLLITLVTITSFSQTTLNGTPKDSIVSISSKQLKETNLIFLEHHNLLEENKLLIKQIGNYRDENNLLSSMIHLKDAEIYEYKGLSEAYDHQIFNLNKEVAEQRKRKMVWKIGGISVSTGLLIWLLLK